VGPAITPVYLVINPANQSISTFAISPTTPVVGGIVVIAASATSQLPVTFSAVGAPASVCSYSTSGLTLSAIGTCTVTAMQSGNGNYLPAKSVTQSITVSGDTQTITFPSIATQIVGNRLTLSASASSGLAVSFTSATPSICLVSGTTATLLADGVCKISASQSGSTTFAAATPVSQSFSVVLSDTVTLGIASGTQAYGVHNSFAIGPSHQGTPVPTGTVTLYDNGIALVTLTLGSNGVAYYTANPLNAGVNVMTASYSGDSHYASGVSAPVNLAVTLAPVNLSGSCWGGTPYKVPYQCVITVSAATATPPTGLNAYYSLDNAPVTSVMVNNGSASFTVATLPAAGTHKLMISYPGQGNYAPAPTITESFTTAAGQTQLLMSPSSYYLAAGSPITLTVTASTPQSGIPTGSVTVYDNGTALGTATIGSNGIVTYTVSSIPKGTNTYTARYAATANYAAATSGGAAVTAH